MPYPVHPETAKTIEIRSSSEIPRDAVAKLYLPGPTLLEIVERAGSSIIVELPDNIAEGDFTLCLAAPKKDYEECGQLKVRKSTPASEGSSIRIRRVEPTIVYKNKESPEIRIYGDGLEKAQRVLLGQARLQHGNLTSESVSGLLYLPVGMPPDFPDGLYELSLMDANGEPFVWTEKIEVRQRIDPPPSLDPQNPVKPTYVSRYGGSVEIRGDVLSQVSRIEIDGELCPSYYCRISRGSGNVLSVDLDGDVVRDADSTVGMTLVFEDDTTLNLPEIQVREPVVPWSVSSWLGFGILVVFAFSFTLALRPDLDGHVANKTMPGVDSLIEWSVSALVSTLLVGAIVAGTWFVAALTNTNYWSKGFVKSLAGSWADVSFSFLALAVVLGVNIALPFSLSQASRLLYPSTPALTLKTLALLFAGIAVWLPFGLGGGVFYQAGCLVVTLGVAGLARRWAARRLEESRRREPTVEKLTVDIEQRLRKAGHVSIAVDFPEVSQLRAMEALRAYYTDHRKGQGLVFEPSEGKLAFQRRDEAVRVAQAFQQARDARLGADVTSRLATSANRLVGSLQAVLPFESQGEAEIYQRIVAFRAKPVELESVLPVVFPLLVLPEGDRLSSDQISELSQILNRLNAQSRFALLLCVESAASIREQIQSHLGGPGRENIVVVDEADCFRIATGLDAVRRGFMAAIRQQADLMVFNPYKDRGPTSADMFYGREGEIRTTLLALDEGSVAVLGARRIGKTSMLQEVTRVLQERDKRLFVLDCYSVKSYEQLFDSIAIKWPSLPKPKRPYRKPVDFGRLVRDLHKQTPDHPFVFIFDEIDSLLVYDRRSENGEAFFRHLRSLSQERRSQFVFSGERTFLSLMDDSRSGFFNFTTPVALDLFDQATTENLVIGPMELVGVTLKEPQEITDLVYKYTSGHPYLIEHLCKEVIKASSDLRIVGRALVEKCARDDEYKKEYRDTFWSQSNPLEKAISIDLVTHGPSSVADVFSRLTELGFDFLLEDLERGTSYLRLCRLIESADNLIRIRPEMFGDFVSMLEPEEWLRNFLAASRKETHA